MPPLSDRDADDDTMTRIMKEIVPHAQAVIEKHVTADHVAYLAYVGALTLVECLANTAPVNIMQVNQLFEDTHWPYRIVRHAEVPPLEESPKKLDVATRDAIAHEIIRRSHETVARHAAATNQHAEYLFRVLLMQLSAFMQTAKGGPASAADRINLMLDADRLPYRMQLCADASIQG
jgi:hypothetical protein